MSSVIYFTNDMRGYYTTVLDVILDIGYKYNACDRNSYFIIFECKVYSNIGQDVIGSEVNVLPLKYFIV